MKDQPKLTKEQIESVLGPDDALALGAIREDYNCATIFADEQIIEDYYTNIPLMYDWLITAIRRATTPTPPAPVEAGSGWVAVGDRLPENVSEDVLAWRIARDGTGLPLVCPAGHLSAMNASHWKRITPPTETREEGGSHE